MKKIGLIGGTGPESTIVYYRRLVYDVQKRAGSACFPNLTIESLSVFDVLNFCEQGNFSGLTQYLLTGIERLAAAGAQYGALTGITPHIVFDELAEASPIPLFSMLDTACSYGTEHQFSKIALFGTLPTMNGTFFQKSFHKAGIQVITPSEDEKNYIGSKIETELEYGKIIPHTREQFCRIANRMISEEGAEAVVLGCTELPLIFEGTRLSVPYMDVMDIHIQALVNLILE